jgi:hypothetical protein
METIDWVGLVPLIVLAVILVVGWVLIRIAFKLTATLFRIGCFVIVLIVAGVFVLGVLGG